MTTPALVEGHGFEASFGAFKGLLHNDKAPFLRPLRAAAMAQVEKLGFPTTRLEDWKHTSVAPILRTRFREPGGSPAKVTAAELLPWSLPELGGPELVFVNGVLVPALSRTAGATGLAALSLRELAARQPERIEPFLNRIARGTPHAFAALNTAFFEDGVVVRIAGGVAASAPVHLLFFTVARDGEPVASYPRVLVLAEPGSEATVVETHGGREGASYLSCPVTEVLVGENASLVRYKLQLEAAAAFHVSELAVRQERSSRFRDLSVSLGAALSRNGLDVALDAEGVECTLDGLFFADAERHTDTHTFIDHAKPHGTSRELYKGVVDGQGRGVFNGRVVVRPGAQKTDAAQSNKNLLLSRKALVHSMPQLEILADDVKCRHGATTGQLDEAAVFYLRSRGLSEAACRSLLTFAFAGELLQRITLLPLRSRVAERLRSLLPGAAEVKEAVL